MNIFSRSIFVSTALVVFLFAGCGQASFDSTVFHDEGEAHQDIPTVQSDMSWMHESSIPFAFDQRVGDVRVFSFDPPEGKELFWQLEEDGSAPRGVADWASSGEEVLINAAYFHEDFSPSGFLLIDGHQIGTRAFDQDLTGLVVIEDGALTIRNTADYPIAFSELSDDSIDAFQSYPLLVVDGIAHVSQDSARYARRTALATTKKGEVLIIISPTGYLSLYEFAQVLESSALDIDLAINLDGGPSTGFWSSVAGAEVSIPSFTRVPSVLRLQLIAQQ
jgi:uncharacterized protein YigE (DUF2233 family)